MEAQLTECLCVCSNIGALSNTVGERGILLKHELYSDAYKKEAIDSIVSMANNNKKRLKMIKKAKKWAVQQTWANRASEWYILFDSFNN